MGRYQSMRFLVGLLALAAVLAVSGADGAAGDDGAALAGARRVRRALQVRAPSPSVFAPALFRHHLSTLERVTLGGVSLGLWGGVCLWGSGVYRRFVVVGAASPPRARALGAEPRVVALCVALSYSPLALLGC